MKKDNSLEDSGISYLRCRYFSTHSCAPKSVSSLIFILGGTKKDRGIESKISEKSVKVHRTGLADRSRDFVYMINQGVFAIRSGPICFVGRLNGGHWHANRRTQRLQNRKM